MLLKLIPLLAMLFFQTNGGAGGGEGGDGSSGNGGNDGQNQGGDGSQQQGDNGAEGNQDGRSTASTSTNSVNRQIKDFAAQRGITVEALLSSYEELENAGKTELQKATGERDRYKSDAERFAAEIRDLRAESGFTKAANDAGALDAETLFMAYKSRLEFDKDGKATNVADVVNDLKKTKPSLFKPATGTSDAGRQGDSPGGSDTDINTKFRRLKTG